MADPLDRLRAALGSRYVLQRLIGSGGMARVYLAEDLKHRREVAVKVFDARLSASVGADRFLREIETAAHLTHPHILPLFDSGHVDGVLYYVMPYVEGESLRARLEREDRLPVDSAIRIGCEIADALAYAHERGIIHRDVKPENILLESGHAVLADFGVARGVAEAREARLTTSGVSLGTPTYMSPEQASGERALDGRSDQYALACVMFEMLAGAPPFAGPSPLAILARQVTERPPSLETVRPNLPRDLAVAIETALAKAPADRHPTVADFRNAVSRGSTGEASAPMRGTVGRRRVALASIPIAVAAVLLGWLVRRPAFDALDDDLVVVFPLDVSGQPAPDETGRGEDNAYLIWNALVGRGSLGWLNALLLVDDSRDASSMSAREHRALAASHGAGLYLHGRIMLSGDESRAYLTLHEVATDSVIARADAAGTRAEASQLGVRAVGGLLLELFPEETVDLSAVTGRAPEAIQALLHAERHFYAGRFQEALEAYSQAVERDSAFALAAVKGAQAASWLHKTGDAEDLIGVALRHVGSLAPRERHFTRGMAAFLSAKADSAVYHFEQAIGIDQGWPEAWTGLGETYTHFLPRKSPQDSLAKDAFTRVYEQTNHSAPALFHLVEFAVRDRDLQRASYLLEEYRRTDPDTIGYGLDKLELMLRCAGDPLSPSDWRDHVLDDVAHVVEAARSLGVGGAYPGCAIEGYRAVLAHDTSTSWRFAASVGLQSMLAATGRDGELIAYLDTVSQYRGNLRAHYIVDALAGASVERQADAVAERLRSAIDSLSGWRAWFLGIWDAHRGRLDEAQQLADALTARSRSTGDRRTSLVAASLRAHVALARGDTLLAMRLLDSLSPSASRGSLYYPWESLGLERLLHARLLLARGQPAKAIREASTFDAPGAANLILPVFLPASLRIRVDAARALGDALLADRMRSRLRALRG